MIWLIFGGVFLWAALAGMAVGVCHWLAGRNAEFERLHEVAFAAGRRSEREDEAREPALGAALLMRKEQRRDCAWCGVVILAGVEPASHGICPGCLSDLKEGSPTRLRASKVWEAGLS